MPGLSLSRCRGQWGNAGEACESGFASAATRVRPGDEQLRRHEHPDTGFGQETRAESVDQRLHRLLEIPALDGEMVDARRGASQGELRRGQLWICRGVESEPLAPGNELAQRKASKFFTKLDRAGHDERLQHVDGRDAGDLGAVPRCDQRAESLTCSARARGGPRGSAQRLARCADSVERVRLRAVLRRTRGGVVELDDALVLRSERRGQAGSVAAGPLSVSGSMRPSSRSSERWSMRPRTQPS